MSSKGWETLQAIADGRRNHSKDNDFDLIWKRCAELAISLNLLNNKVALEAGFTPPELVMTHMMLLAATLSECPKDVQEEAPARLKDMIEYYGALDKLTESISGKA